MLKLFDRSAPPTEHPSGREVIRQAPLLAHWGGATTAFPKRRCRPVRGWRSASVSEKLCHAFAAREDQVYCAEIRSPT
jgi:hypothetical protein